MGGSSPKAPPTPDSENAAAESALYHRGRFKQFFQPQQQAYVDEASRDFSSLLKGRNNADVMQDAGGLGNHVAGGGGSGRLLGERSSSVAAARSTALLGANVQAQQLADKSRLGALGLGMDMAADAENGLVRASSAANTRALGKLRADSIRSSSQMALVGSAIGAGMGKYRGMQDLDGSPTASG